MAKIIKANVEYNSVDTTAGDDSFTCTAVVGKTYEVKNIGSGGFTLTVNYGTDTADLEDDQCAQFTYDGVGWCVFDINETNENVSALDARVTTNEGDIDNLEGSIVTMSATMSYTITTDTYRVVIDASTVSADSQVLTLVEGASVTRLNSLQVYNGSDEAITIEDDNDSANTFTIEAGSYADFFFQGSILEQEVSSGDGGGDGAVVGDIKWTVSDIESNGWKNADYSSISQSTYAELFALIGHGYAKDSTDATTAEGAGTFHIPDGRFLFPRAGIFSWNPSATDIDISTDQITITGHGMETDGSMNGRPMKLLRVPGQNPTMPTGTGYIEYDQNYVRVIDADTIELYDTEAHAIDTTSNDGRVDWTDAGSGVYKLTSQGCYQESAVQRLTGSTSGFMTTDTNPDSDGILSGTSKNSDGTRDGGSAQSDPYTLRIDSADGIGENHTSDNETRGANVSLNMQIKVIGVSVSTGEAYDTVVYDSRYTIPSPAGGAAIPITHNLDTELEGLVIKIFWDLLGDGTAAYDLSLNTSQYDSGVGGTHEGYSIYSNGSDTNSFIFQFADDNATVVAPNGEGTDIIGIGYLRVVIYKPSLFAVTKTSQLVTATEAQIIEIETVEKTVIIPDTITEAFDLTLAAGAGINRTHKINIINESDYIIPVKYGTQEFWLEKQRTQFYLNGTTLVWASAGWELVWEDFAGALSSTSVDIDSQNIGGVFTHDWLELVGYYDSGSEYRNANLRIPDTGEKCSSTYSGGSNAWRINFVPGSPGSFVRQDVGSFRSIRRWHDAK